MTSAIGSMTETDALARAKHLLGSSARVHHAIGDRHAPFRISAVRYLVHGTRRVIVARGLTWERAHVSLDRYLSKQPRRRARKPRPRTNAFPPSALDL